MLPLDDAAKYVHTNMCIEACKVNDRAVISVVKQLFQVYKHDAIGQRARNGYFFKLELSPEKILTHEPL